MLIVFADDFSGAAEIGGVAYSNGLKAQIQKTFKNDKSLDVIIIDMDSRILDKQSAFEKAKSISTEVYATYPDALFFKKVDSAFRGHIASEIEAHLGAIPFNSVVLLPNNPLSGRIVKKGKYFIQDVPLHKTPLASDSDFPRTSNTIRTLFQWENISFPYSHLTIDKEIPKSPFICTADITTTDDLNNRLKKTTDKDLICGSGETFRAFVKNLKVNKKPVELESIGNDYTILINGSTIKNEAEKDFLNENDIPIFILPIKENYFEEWILIISNVLKSQKFIAIYPDSMSKQDSKWILNQLDKTISFLLKTLKNNTAHLLMTGGATASTILEASFSGQYQIIKEQAPGVVTIQDIDNKDIKITTKPGSYPWGQTLFNELYDKKKTYTGH